MTTLSRLFATSIAFLLSLSPLAWGVTYDGQRVSKTNPGSTCTDPPAATAFLSTDTAVYLYFYATTSLADQITSDWLAPDGAVVTGSVWGNPVSGRYCYTGASLGNLSQLPPSRLGGWQARVYANGTPLFAVAFVLDSAGLVITNASIPDAVLGVPYNQPLAVAGGRTPYSWSATGLPGGLGLNASTGVLSGTPASAGKFNVTVRVTDGSSPALAFTTSPPLPLTVAPSPRPVVSEAGGVVNGASFQSGLSSGAWMTVLGTNLSTTTRIWQTSDFAGTNLPMSLDGVRVTTNGRAAYIYYISPTQINALAPDDPATGPVPVQVINSFGSSNVVTVTKQPMAPALFAYSQQGGHYAVAQDGLTYALIAPAGFLGNGAATKPATPGEILVLYATGLGATSPAYPPGQTFQGAMPLATPPLVTIGGVPATVQFGGIVGAGLYQINLVVPDVPTGDASVVVGVGGAQSSPKVFIPIQAAGGAVTTLATAYTYDAASRIASIAYPSGWKVSYTRDAMGRVTAVSALAPGSSSSVPIVSNIAYEPFGPVTSLTYGNAAVDSRTFDLDYRLTNILDAGSKPIQNLAYGYDAADNVLSITDGILPGNTQRLGYDALDRLTSATGAYGSLTYTYDAAGNRLTQTAGTATTTYTIASHGNRLTAISASGATQTLGYTATGNVNSFSPGLPPPGGAAPLTGLTYGQSGRLAAVAAGSSTVAQYRYDAFGQRLVKIEPSSSTTTLYQYDLSGRLLEERNNLGNPAASDYIYLDDGLPVATLTPAAGRVYFLHSDRLGTPQAATDTNQAVVWSAAYQPFGQTTSLQTSLLQPQNLRLPGQESDADSGFYHNGFRDYASAWGRYLQSDPAGLRGGLNAYAYAQGNPASYVDPQGTTVTSVGLNGQLALLLGFSGNVALVRDDKGNIGIALTPGVSLGIQAGATISGYASLTSDNTIFDLNEANYSATAAIEFKGGGGVSGGVGTSDSFVGVTEGPVTEEVHDNGVLTSIGVGPYAGVAGNAQRTWVFSITDWMHSLFPGMQAPRAARAGDCGGSR